MATQKKATHSYNVAVITEGGSPLCTQLWKVEHQEPYRVVVEWYKRHLEYGSAEISTRCPVVIAQHGGPTDITTVGMVLAYGSAAAKHAAEGR